MPGRKKSKRRASTRVTRPLRKNEVRCFRCRRPRKFDAVRDCDFCGRHACPDCDGEYRECSWCYETACGRCAKDYFTFPCPNCDTGHHDDCSVFLTCDVCGDFACDECGGDTNRILCEGCDVRSYCASCEGQTYNGETLEMGACEGCDIIGGARTELRGLAKHGRYPRPHIESRRLVLGRGHANGSQREHALRRVG